MKIVIDHVLDALTGKTVGIMFIDTTPGNVPPPASAADWIVFLTSMNSSKSTRTAGGWDVVNQLPGESAPMTRWQRLVLAANAPGADANIKALGLSGT